MELREKYWWLNEESEQVLNRGYLLKGETAQDAVERVTSAAAKRLLDNESRFNVKKYNEYQSKFQELVERGWMSLSSPIWANMGTKRGLPISCFNTHVPDSIEGITNKLSEVIMQTKIGGGTSGYFGELRGRGAAITDNGVSSGSVSFMQLFDTAMNVVSQGSCFKAGTRVLTQRGFVDFRSVVEGEDLIYELDEFGNGNFTSKYTLVNSLFTGDMYNFTGQHYDVNVTENHLMVYHKKDKKTKQWSDTSEKVRADKLPLVNYMRIPLTSTFKNENSIPFTDEDRFRIAIEADGHIQLSNSSLIKFSLTKDKKIKRLVQILNNLNIQYTLTKGVNVTNIEAEVSKYYTKLFDWVEYEKISEQWARDFIEEASLWGGSIKNNGKTIEIANTNKKIIDVYNVLSLLAGYRPTVRDENSLFIISISKTHLTINTKSLKKEITPVKEERVFCAVVPKGRIIVEYNGVSTVISNTRRGAFAAYLDIDHPDILEFLQIKDIGHPIQNLFTGVCVPDYWMQQMVEGDTDKRAVWAKVLESRQNKGLPYIFFTDNINKNKPQVYIDKKIPINASNLCVSGDTKILTANGYETIEKLDGRSVKVWNGSEWSETQVIKTGTNQKLVKVVTDSGYELDCTPYHKFYTHKGMEIRAEQLRKGDKLIKFELPIIEGNLDLDNAYVNGFYSGDGCFVKRKKRIYLYGEKQKLISNFNIISDFKVQPKQNRTYGHTHLLEDKFFVPNASYKIESRLKWLAGYLDADGTVTNNNGSQSLQIASINIGFLKNIQLMLQTLGVDAKIKLARIAGNHLLPKNDGSGDMRLYHCKKINRLLINGNALYKLSILGLTCDRLKWDIKKPNRECIHFVQIVEVSEVEGLHDTFCFEEPKRHLGMFNGILTGQCSEIALPSTADESFVCCLSSMNLELYDEWKDTDAVKWAIFFLDAVMSEFIEKTKDNHHLMSAHKFAKNHRALGLGVLGWHSYLQSKMIPFESLEAKLHNNLIFSSIKDKADLATVELAKLYGEPEILKKYGRRNTTTLAIAPTTSSSSILGQVSAGIEPFASNYFKAGLSKGNFIRKNKYLDALLEVKGINTEETWRDIMLNKGSVQHIEELTDKEKEVFKTFRELSQYEIILQAANRQKYIDQSQSLNINIPPDLPIKETNKLIIEAWKLGVKTLYYQRSSSISKDLLTNIVSCSSCES